MTGDLIDLVHGLGRPKVLVVGDVMLDRYIWGDAERISQEAPVILLHADKREERLGGASSVATMLAALEAVVELVGVVGVDADGPRVRKVLADLDIRHEGVIEDASRPTTVKERYIGRAQHRHPQQMIRVDFEARDPLSPMVERNVIRLIEERVAHADVVLVSDYDKGVCTPTVLQATIAAAKRRGLRTLVDPIRGKDYRKYAGCSAMTPNRLEAGLATGRVLNTANEALEAAAQLQATLGLEAGIVTLDKDGMALAHSDGTHRLLPTRPRQVYDITGAGDMVLSVLGMALATGADYDRALRLANIAGGLEVEKIGVATISREEILRDLAASGSPHEDQKVLPLGTLLDELAARRRLGQRVAFTNGCFDILHPGHVRYLRQAREQANLLVVGLNDDASVRRLKGPSRPIHAELDRAAVLAALQAVDYVTFFDGDTPLGLIEAVRPDVLVKGADWRREDVVGGDFVESYGGRVYLAPLLEGHSTTNLAKRLNAA